MILINQEQAIFTPQYLQESVAQLVITTLGNKWRNVVPNDPLLASQEGFDSVSLMEFVLRLEDTFNLHIPDEDLDPDIFYSIETIVAYLQSRLE